MPSKSSRATRVSGCRSWCAPTGSSAAARRTRPAGSALASARPLDNDATLHRAALEPCSGRLRSRVHARARRSQAPILFHLAVRPPRCRLTIWAVKGVACAPCRSRSAGGSVGSRNAARAATAGSTYQRLTTRVATKPVTTPATWLPRQEAEHHAIASVSPTARQAAPQIATG